jgi:hypothetical protein
MITHAALRIQEAKEHEMAAIVELLEQADVASGRVESYRAVLGFLSLPELKRRRAVIHDCLESISFSMEPTPARCEADGITMLIDHDRRVDDADDLRQLRLVWRWRTRLRKELTARLHELEAQIGTTTPLDISKLRRSEDLTIIEARVNHLEQRLAARQGCPDLETAMAVSCVKDHL